MHKRVRTGTSRCSAFGASACFLFLSLTGQGTDLPADQAEPERQQSERTGQWPCLCQPGANGFSHSCSAALTLGILPVLVATRMPDRRDDPTDALSAPGDGHAEDAEGGRQAYFLPQTKRQLRSAEVPPFTGCHWREPEPLATTEPVAMCPDMPTVCSV